MYVLYNYGNQIKLQFELAYFIITVVYDTINKQTNNNNTAHESCSLLGVDLEVNMSLLGLDKCQHMYRRLLE